MDAVREHISYCNYYIGVVDEDSDDHKKFVVSTEKAFQDANETIDFLVRTVAHLSSESSVQPHSQALLAVTKAAEAAYAALQSCMDTLQEQDKVREKIKRT